MLRRNANGQTAEDLARINIHESSTDLIRESAADLIRLAGVKEAITLSEIEPVMDLFVNGVIDVNTQVRVQHQMS